MGLFGKKQPTIGDPIYIDMRHDAVQLSAEDNKAISNMTMLDHPKKCSSWYMSTLGMSSGEEFLMPLDIPIERIPKDKLIRPVYFEPDLLNALLTKEDPKKLLFEFGKWVRSGASAPEQGKFDLLAWYMERTGVNTKDFAAILVPEYSTLLQTPGLRFSYFVLLQPKDPNWNPPPPDYVVLGNLEATPGVLYSNETEAMQIFNLGKAIPALVRVSITGWTDDDVLTVHYYLPDEIVDILGWEVEEDEGVPHTIAR